MQPERWHRVDDILQAALALQPAERSAFIDGSCGGDESLRDEVMSLLSLEQGPLDLIDTPALEVAAPLLASDQPDLSEGQLIGHYRIVSLLGIGGMGEVYLAKDEKLNRRIALKLLPTDYTRNQARLRRFEQEAQAASALNHPNILTIHEIGQVDDQQFIATEFVEGETLRERLKRRGLTLTETLDVTTQVAGALAAAHKAGIVHRDVKPENIMLRPDGYVKVLDFGLAKLTEQQESTSRARSVDDVNISSGLVMGTVKYMSPEQARGLSVDARSDIFSLGVVLYEMLTGRTPFKGDATGDLIKSILKDEPAPLSQFVPQVPLELEQIVAKALAKNREERYQTINDLLAAVGEERRKLDIEQTLDGIQRSGASLGTSRITHPLGLGVPTATSQSITEQVVSLITQHKLQTSLTFLIVVVAVAGVFYSSTKLWHKRAAFQDVKMSQLVETDKSHFAAVSPDGKYIAHTVIDGNKTSLMLRPTATNSNTVLVPPTDAWFGGVTFSRDGDHVYYGMWGKDDPTYALYRVSISGGDSQKVLANVGSPITFSPDGNRFAFVRDISTEETGLFISNADGTDERLLGKRHSPKLFSPAGPSWSADGKLIACAIVDEHPNERPSSMNVIGVNVDDGTERLLTTGNWSKILQVAWLSDNSGFIMAATERGQGALLWYVSYPGGNLRRLTNDPGNYPSNYNSISLTADSRTLIAARFELRTNLWAAPPRDPSQIKQITFGGNHRYQRLAWTPDGKIVFPSDASGDREIWIMEADGSSQKPLTAEGRFNQLPAVSPDGRYIVYSSSLPAADNRHVWRMNIDGSDPVQLTQGGDEFGPQCSPDSRWVFYMSATSATFGTIWKVSIDGGEPEQFTKELTMWPAVSPDEMLVACWWWSRPNTPPKIALIPFVGGEPVRFVEPLPKTTTPMPLRWASDGQALIYCVTRNGISNIWRQPVDGGPPKQLTDFKSEAIQGFDWSKDDRLLVSRGFSAREIVLMEDVSR
ncbi:MAG TPA: protein kinase [Pyrinomonadaceae bacterium]|nr:protein kinase [Pyrinomonadaceae bacterium]